MQPIGPAYNNAGVEATAGARAKEDKSHEYVHWLCLKCHKTETTLVDKKLTYLECKCGYYMQWSYRPFAAYAA